MMYIVPVFLALAAFQASATSFSPFEPAQHVQNHQGYLFQRQNQCPSDQKFCPETGGTSGCCRTDSQCAADDAGQLACCPSGAACTGRLEGDSGAGTPAGLQVATGTPPSQPTQTMNPDQGGMTVPNPYYPYVMLPTTYPNAELCSSAFSSCRSEFTRCTNSLTAGGNGVTVSGAQGGITAQPALDAASAGAVCTSLSRVACYNLGLGNCPMYGTAAAAGGASPAGNDAPGGCIQLYRVAVAIVVGVAGQAV